MELVIYLLPMALLFLLLVYFFVKQIWGPRRMDFIKKMLDAGQYKRAAREAQMLLKKNERNHRAHYLLGLAYFYAQQMEQAMVEFKYLTKLNKYDDMVKEVDVRNKLAEIYLHFGQMEEAQKEFLLIIKLNPTNYEVLYKIAKIFFDRGYLDNAYAYFTKVLQINKKHPEANYHMGVILYQAHKELEAAEFFKSATRYDPRLHKANYYLGMINKKNRSLRPAITCFDDAQKDPEFTLRARLGKGQCYFEMGDINKAVIEFTRSIKDVREEDSVSLALRYSLAACYEEMRDLPSAIEQWEKIASIKPNYNDVLEKLSMYQELRTNDHLKDFLTASNNVFEQICRDMITSLGLDIVKFQDINGNHAMALATEAESKWRNVKVSNKLIHIYRGNEPILESTVRAIQEEMRENNANKAICITSTKFSPGAREFANARPIDLIDKEGLAKMLKKLM